jgi:hypothetical protein
MQALRSYSRLIQVTVATQLIKRTQPIGGRIGVRVIVSVVVRERR